jgi:hypothetical protein
MGIMQMRAIRMIGRHEWILVGRWGLNLRRWRTNPTAQMTMAVRMIRRK